MTTDHKYEDNIQAVPSESTGLWMDSKPATIDHVTKRAKIQHNADPEVVVSYDDVAKESNETDAPTDSEHRENSRISVHEKQMSRLDLTIKKYEVRKMRAENEKFRSQINLEKVKMKFETFRHETLRLELEVNKTRQCVVHDK